MTYLGIDFGTTNTVAAVMGAGDAAPRVLALEGASGTVRTALYVERDQTMTIGRAAIQTYRVQNVGRVPRFVKKYIGTIDIELGELLAKGYDLKGGAVIVDVFTDVDADAPGRLLHALKGPLASDYEGTSLFGKQYALEDLIAAFLEQIRIRIGNELGALPDRAVFGRPVNFANAAEQADNDKAQLRLTEAAHRAGFREVVFELEPIGAALAFGVGTHSGGTAFVFDFGGGTLDVAVVRIDTYGGQHVLATGGVGIAGDHFDQAIFKRALAPWFGAQVHWGPQRLSLPSDLLAALGDWQNIPMLATAQILDFIRDAQRDCDDPPRLFALEQLIAKGYGYDVYERVEQCKTALSGEALAIVAYEAGAIDIWQPVLRSQFEAYIAPERRKIEALIHDTLSRAGVSAGQIDTVVRTGGSSAIPCFVEMLSRIFGRDKLVEQDRFTGVANGLAVRARDLRLSA